MDSKNKLSFYNIFCIAFGGIIGWGAFILPGSLFLQKASFFEVCMAFLLSTVAILCIAASYCLNFRLSTDSGGEISSTHFSFGKKHGFFCGWMVILVYISIVALNVSALPTVLRQINPELFSIGHLYRVEGWDVYFSELLICTSAIVFFAYTNSRVARRVGNLQNVVTSLLLAVVIVLSGSLFSTGTVSLAGQFSTGPDTVNNVFIIFAIAPWAYIGFNIIPQVKMDTSISTRKAYVLMAVSVLCGTLVYLSLTLVTLAGTCNFSTGLDQPWITGWAVQQLLGDTGLYLIFLGIFTAVLAGINAFLYGSARLLQVMGLLNLLPDWFTKTRRDVPVNGVLFVTLVTLVAPFFGRTVLTWIVDMSSVGAAIGFLYTGLSGLKATPRSKWVYLVVHGITCLVALLFLYLLLNPYLTSSLSLQSYIALFIWLAMGFAFYVFRSGRFGVDKPGALPSNS